MKEMKKSELIKEEYLQASPEMEEEGDEEVTGPYQNVVPVNDDDKSGDNMSGVEDDDEQVQPLLFVDINLGGDTQERIVVFEGDTAPELARQFCVEHNLDDETMEKLQQLLEQQMAGVLPKIEEDEYNSEEDQ